MFFGKDIDFDYFIKEGFVGLFIVKLLKLVCDLLSNLWGFFWDNMCFVCY